MSNRFPDIVLVCILAGLAGCASISTTSRVKGAEEFKAERLAEVTVGMPIENAVDILGTPTSFGRDEQGRYFYRYQARVLRSDADTVALPFYTNVSMTSFHEGMDVNVFHDQGRVTLVTRVIYPGKAK